MDSASLDQMTEILKSGKFHKAAVEPAPVDPTTGMPSGMPAAAPPATPPVDPMAPPVDPMAGGGAPMDPAAMMAAMGGAPAADPTAVPGMPVDSMAAPPVDMGLPPENAPEPDLSEDIPEEGAEDQVLEEIRQLKDDLSARLDQLDKRFEAIEAVQGDEDDFEGILSDAAGDDPDNVEPDEELAQTDTVSHEASFGDRLAKGQSRTRRFLNKLSGKK